MKKKLFLLPACLIFSLVAAPPPKKPIKPPYPMLKGCIVSNELETIPNFKIYYNGAQTVSNDDGFFTIPLEAGKVENLSLLICKDFAPKFEGTNTIKNFSINTKKSYNYFTLTKATLPLLKTRIDQLKEKIKPLTMRANLIKRQIERQKKYLAQAKNKKLKKGKKRKKKLFYRPAYYEQNLKKLRKRKKIIALERKNIKKDIARFKEKYLTFQNATPEKPAGDYWFIDKKSLRKSVVPEHCVIVSLNPKVVDRVENWNFSLSQHFTTFPRIVLKTNLETRNVKKKQSITRSALKSELYALEKKVFHEQKQEVIKYFDKQPNVRVSLLQ